jgi:hypothetical protein
MMPWLKCVSNGVCYVCLSLRLPGSRDWGYGVVVSAFRKQQQDRIGIPDSSAAAYVIDTLLCCAGSGSNGSQQGPAPAQLNADNAEMHVSRGFACTCPASIACIAQQVVY